MAEDRKPDDRKADAKPTDPLASAAAFGMAMAAQTVEFWFGVASGLARAGQDMVERHNRADAEKGAIRPDNLSPVAAAKAATRTVMADVERAAKDFAEVAQKVGAPAAPKAVKAAAPKPAKAEPAPKAIPISQSADNVVVLKPATKAAEKPVTEKPLAEKPASNTVPAQVAATRVEAPANRKPETSAKAAKAEKKAMPAEKTEKKVTPKAAPAPKPVSEKPHAAGNSARMMPEDFRAPKYAPRPTQPDDLKKIEGVGPKLEQLLNSLGVWTFAQIAGWAPEEIAYVEDMTGLEGRIAADKWLEQAAALAKAEG